MYASFLAALSQISVSDAPEPNWALEVLKSVVAPIVVTIATYFVIDFLTKRKERAARKDYPLHLRLARGDEYVLRNVSKRHMLKVSSAITDVAGNHTGGGIYNSDLAPGEESVIHNLPAGYTFSVAWRDYPGRRTPSWERDSRYTEPIRIMADKTQYELKLGPGPSLGG